MEITEFIMLIEAVIILIISCILEFIDSKDVREYNKDTQFSSIEQAVLIFHSKATSVEQKISAWEELLSVYDIDEFQEAKYVAKEIYGYETKIYKDIVSNTLFKYKNALESIDNKENVVYEAYIVELDYPENINAQYFSTYKKSYSYLENKKQKYYSDDDIKIKAEITLKNLDDTMGCKDIRYEFDNNMQMINIYPACTEGIDAEDDIDLGVFCIIPPLPFKREIY